MLTQREIAESLGLSCATVANILSGKPGLRYSQKTRDLVLNAAAESGYQCNRASRTIRTGKSNLIGIVHFGAGLEAAAKTNQVLSTLVSEAGYDCLSIDMNWHRGRVERTISEIIEARVEGVFISHIQDVIEDEHLDVLSRARIPVVFVNGECRPNVTMMSDRVRMAFASLGQHLIDVGHQTIIQVAVNLLGPSVANRTQSERHIGFQDAIQAHGNWSSGTEEAFFKWWEHYQPEDGKIVGYTILQDSLLYTNLERPVYHFAKRLFRTGKLPDAVVCTNDMYALEFIATGLEHDIRVPRDIAVTGYDNDRISSYPAFGITTAEQSTDKICAAAMQAMLSHMKNPKAVVQSQQFDSRIIIRNSSQPSQERVPQKKKRRSAVLV